MPAEGFSWDCLSWKDSRKGRDGEKHFLSGGEVLAFRVAWDSEAWRDRENSGALVGPHATAMNLLSLVSVLIAKVSQPCFVHTRPQ